MPRILPSIAALGALLLAVATTARGDEIADVARLVAAGQPQQALAAAERHLAEHPNDAAMRFQRGVILSDLGRGDDAIDAFTRLTQDFPDLPEPYNNLGVLLAARGEYDQARAAFEAAIRNNPGYAVAHENLGDIHAVLASRAYAQAIRLEPANVSAPPKLALIRELLARSPRAAGTAAPAVRAPAS